ncbi:MAG: hypothetical protein AB7H96_22955 [Vicinamibacterales bacterium]
MASRLVIATTLSVGVVLGVAPDASAQQLPAQYAMDFPCAGHLFPGSGAVEATARKAAGAIGRGIGRLRRRSAPPAGVPMPEPNAVCRTQALEETLLLTGRMIDRAAYSAAKGVDAVQVALGRQRTFLVPIAELERAFIGLGISDPDKTEVVIREASAESQALLLEVQQMKDSMRTDPVVTGHLKRPQTSLHEAEYYAITAVVGGSLFGKGFSAATNQERAQLALASERAGLASDFAQEMPDRSARARTTVTDSVALRGGISTVVANAEGDEQDEGGTKQAKAQALADLEAARQVRSH